MLNEVVSKNYMIAGYAAILSVLALYLISLIIRWRNLKRDLQTIKEFQNKTPQESPGEGLH
ncbi:MAG: hypothetical protein ABSG01_10295 [Anaerolineales bacterium]|jgi:hypothetical protein